MKNFITFWFENTSGQDQTNYFSGETNLFPRCQSGSFIEMTPGTYRIIDGNYYKISSEIPEFLYDSSRGYR